MAKVIYIDTNIFIRFLVKDVPFQLKESKDIFNQIKEEKLNGFISILVINESIWILENYYKLKREDYLPDFLKLLSLPKIAIEEIEKNLLITILSYYKRTRLDFTDVYLFYTADNRKIVSFDKDFEKLKRLG